MARTPLFQKKFDTKKRSNVLSALQVEYIDYKNLKLLRKFMSVFERVLPARITGNSPRHQRMVAQAVKRARYMALLPYHPGHNAPEGDRNF